MTFESFDPAAALMVAAFLSPPPLEPPVSEQNHFSVRLALAGYPGPYAVRASSEGVIVDRDGQPFEQVLPVFDSTGDRRATAVIACIALNRLCGFADTAIVHGPDPVEVAVVVSLQQTGRPAAAAE